MHSVIVYLGLDSYKISFKYYKLESVLATRMYVTEPTMMSDKKPTLPCIFLTNFFQWRNSKLESSISYQAQPYFEYENKGRSFPETWCFIDLYDYYLSQWLMGKVHKLKISKHDKSKWKP